MDKSEGQIRALQELVEQGWMAVSNIGPSEIRLMNKPIREALAAFQDDAVKVVADLTLARYREGQDVAGADEGEPAETGQVVLIDRPPTDEEAKAGSLGSGHMIGVAGTQAPEPEELGETVMCPHTRRGVSCTRTLHNVGLHTPKGYPVNESWTDKESD